jgi:hypothetical protein
MKEQNQKPKTKMIMKANIKLYPEVKQKIDKTTKIVCYATLIIVLTGIIYLLLASFVLPTESVIPPTEKEIKEYCEQKNMLPDGYTISYTEATWLWIFKDKSKEQAYINCKSKFPKETYENPEPTIPECCYPTECPQAINNPKYCNCIYLIYCIKQGNEYKEWIYKINGQ